MFIAVQVQFWVWTAWTFTVPYWKSSWLLQLLFDWNISIVLYGSSAVGQAVLSTDRQLSASPEHRYDQLSSGEWGETDLQYISVRLCLPQTWKTGLFPTCQKCWNFYCTVAIASQSHPAVPCLSLSSLPYNLELIGGQHLLPCTLPGLKEQEVVMRLFPAKKKKSNGVRHVLGSSEDCIAAETQGSRGWVI